MQHQLLLAELREYEGALAAEELGAARGGLSWRDQPPDIVACDASGHGEEHGGAQGDQAQNAVDGSDKLNLVVACQEAYGAREGQEYRESEVFLVEVPGHLVDDGGAGIGAIEIYGSFDDEIEAEPNQGQGETLHLYHSIHSLHPPHQLLIELDAHKEYQRDQ